MPYCTLQDLIDRGWEEELLQLTDLAGAGAIDEVPVNRAIADADADIEPRLRPVCTLPLVTVDPILKRIACDLARYYLHGQLAPDHVKDRGKQAWADLDAIAAGRLKIDDGTGAAITSDGPPDYEAPERVFTADSLADY
jgi:phage gp36-like protein